LRIAAAAARIRWSWYLFFCETGKRKSIAESKVHKSSGKATQRAQWGKTCRCAAPNFIKSVGLRFNGLVGTPALVGQWQKSWNLATHKSRKQLPLACPHTSLRPMLFNYFLTISDSLCFTKNIKHQSAKPL
jgi:hypothetical protein